MLKKADEMAWLDKTNKIVDFAFPYSGEMVGFKV